MLELRAQAEIFQGLLAREGGLVSLPVSIPQQPTGGREEGAPTFIFCRKVPWHADSPLPITNIASVICPSLSPWDFANEQAGSEEMSGHRAAIKG